MSDFKRVGDFHRKFGLPDYEPRGGPPPDAVDDSVVDFRVKFLLEELAELCDGYGLDLRWEIQQKPFPAAPCPSCSHIGPDYYQHRCPATPRWQDLPKIADALVDLVYVALGTAQLHRLPWARLFMAVHRANMRKERAAGTDDPRSTRPYALNVVKPAGWRPPDVIGALTRAGWKGPRLPYDGGKP